MQAMLVAITNLGRDLSSTGYIILIVALSLGLGVMPGVAASSDDEAFFDALDDVLQIIHFGN